MASNANMPAAGPEKSFDGVSSRESDIIKAGLDDTEKPKEPSKAEEDILADGEDLDSPPKDTKVEDELEDLDQPPIEDELETDQSLPGRVSFKEINKEFPELLKKYPELRANYFQAEKYKEVFPTIEDATIASQKTEVFDSLDPYIAKGDLTPFLNIFKNAGNQDALENTASTILPALYKVSPQLYIQALNPELKKLYGLMKRSNDENLTAAADVFAQYVWGGSIPADPAPAKVDPEKQQLQQQLNQQTYSIMAGKDAEVKATAEKYFVKEIENALDPNKDTFSDTMRSVLTEKVNGEIQQAFLASPKLQREFNSLWIDYARKNFSAEAKSRLIRAVLGRAKSILPAIAKKYRDEALNKPQIVQQDELTVGKRKTNINQSSAPSRGRSNYISPKQAKQERMSEMDIIMAGSK